MRLALCLKCAPWMPLPAVLGVVLGCWRLWGRSRGEGKVPVFEGVPVEAGQVWWRHDMAGYCRCRIGGNWARSPQSILSGFLPLSELDGRYSQHN